MKKIISLMLAVTMICASIGLTAFAATTTTVEAEADGVSAYTLPSSDKSNSKILKNTVSSKESVTYIYKKTIHQERQCLSWHK